MTIVQSGRSSFVRIVLCLCLLPVLAGCHTAPDMKPFTQATTDLATAVKTAGRAVGDEITTVTADWPDQQKAVALGIKTKFLAHWVGRGKLADALTDYSQSLTAIVEAGEQGEQSAKALAGSFGKLCDAVGVVFPPAVAGDVLVNASAKVYGMMARDRAARTLGGNMKNMQSSLEEVVGVLQQDLTSIEEGLQALRVEASQTANDTKTHSMLPRSERNALARDTERRETLREQSAQLTERLDDARVQLVSLADADRKAAERAAAAPADNALVQAATQAASLHQAADRQLASLGTASDALARQLSQVESSITLSLQALVPVDAAIKEAENRIDAEIQLVRTTRAGLQNWSDTHARLADAALEAKPPRVEDLVEVSLEIRDLVKQIRSPKK